jgi:hypothetical protein
LRNDEKLKAFGEHHAQRTPPSSGAQGHPRQHRPVRGHAQRKRPDGQHQDLAHPINDSAL